MHSESIISEFTHQSAAFNVAPVMRSAEALQGLIDFIPTDPSQSWVDLACGPGLVARALAPRVGSVLGLDMTAPMIELAEREAAREGLTNTRFAIGDATALELPDGSVDGAVTRFSLHHIPRPGRCVAEMARVVRPGGYVVLADHLSSADREEAGWHEEIERLRDPSHWSCLPAARVRQLGEAAGLTLLEERIVPLRLDFEEWLTRGSGGETARSLIEAALRERPSGAWSFAVQAGADGRAILHLNYGLTLWRR